MAAEVSALPASRQGLRTIAGVELIEPLNLLSSAQSPHSCSRAHAAEGGAAMLQSLHREIARISLSADGVAADVSAGGCGHAAAVNHVHARSASLADLCDHVVRLRKRRD